MSKSEVLHQLYNECKDIEFDESYELIKKAETEDEKKFIQYVTIYVFITSIFKIYNVKL